MSRILTRYLQTFGMSTIDITSIRKLWFKTTDLGEYLATLYAPAKSTTVPQRDLGNSTAKVQVINHSVSFLSRSIPALPTPPMTMQCDGVDLRTSKQPQPHRKKLSSFFTTLPCRRTRSFSRSADVRTLDWRKGVVKKEDSLYPGSNGVILGGNGCAADEIYSSGECQKLWSKIRNWSRILD